MSSSSSSSSSSSPILTQFKLSAFSRKRPIQAISAPAGTQTSQEVNESSRLRMTETVSVQPLTNRNNNLDQFQEIGETRDLNTLPDEYEESVAHYRGSTTPLITFLVATELGFSSQHSAKFRHAVLMHCKEEIFASMIADSRPWSRMVEGDMPPPSSSSSFSQNTASSSITSSLSFQSAAQQVQQTLSSSSPSDLQTSNEMSFQSQTLTDIYYEQKEDTSVLEFFWRHSMRTTNNPTAPRPPPFMGPFMIPTDTDIQTLVRSQTDSIGPFFKGFVNLAWHKYRVVANEKERESDSMMRREETSSPSTIIEVKDLSEEEKKEIKAFETAQRDHALSDRFLEGVHDERVTAILFEQILLWYTYHNIPFYRSDAKQKSLDELLPRVEKETSSSEESEEKEGYDTITRDELVTLGEYQVSVEETKHMHETDEFLSQRKPGKRLASGRIVNALTYVDPQQNRIRWNEPLVQHPMTAVLLPIGEGTPMNTLRDEFDVAFFSRFHIYHPIYLMFLQMLFEDRYHLGLRRLLMAALGYLLNQALTKNQAMLEVEKSEHQTISDYNELQHISATGRELMKTYSEIGNSLFVDYQIMKRPNPPTPVTIPIPLGSTLSSSSSSMTHPPGPAPRVVSRFFKSIASGHDTRPTPATTSSTSSSSITMQQGTETDVPTSNIPPDNEDTDVKMNTEGVAFDRLQELVQGDSNVAVDPPEIPDFLLNKNYDGGPLFSVGEIKKGTSYSLDARSIYELIHEGHPSAEYLSQQPWSSSVLKEVEAWGTSHSHTIRVVGEDDHVVSLTVRPTQTLGQVILQVCRLLSDRVEVNQTLEELKLEVSPGYLLALSIQIYVPFGSEQEAEIEDLNLRYTLDQYAINWDRIWGVELNPRRSEQALLLLKKRWYVFAHSSLHEDVYTFGHALESSLDNPRDILNEYFTSLMEDRSPKIVEQQEEDIQTKSDVPAVWKTSQAHLQHEISKGRSGSLTLDKRKKLLEMIMEEQQLMNLIRVFENICEPILEEEFMESTPSIETQKETQPITSTSSSSSFLFNQPKF